MANCYFPLGLIWVILFVSVQDAVSYTDAYPPVVFTSTNDFVGNDTIHNNTIHNNTNPNSTSVPTGNNTVAPTNATTAPTNATDAPSTAPTNVTVAPTSNVTVAPNVTDSPTVAPTPNVTVPPNVTDPPTTVPPSSPTSPPSSPTSPPTMAPTLHPRHHHASVGKIIGRTIAWLILVGLSVLLFGAAMSNRYRIYYFLRGVYYSILQMECTRYIVTKIRLAYYFVRGGGRGGDGYNLNTIVFDQGDPTEGLLMRTEDENL